jgi:SWI/SNF-related matrix-associated actin-dependent regulator of chromatin subfamily A3
MFRNAISHPIETDCTQGFTNLRLLLKSICLRRTKDLLRLPEPISIEYKLQLSPAEIAQYANIGEEFKQTIDAAVSCRNTTEAYQGILQALLRLRLLCNNGTIEHSANIKSECTDPEDMLALLQQGDQAICAYCRCEIRTISDIEPDAGRFTECWHLLCVNCMTQYRQEFESNRGEEAPQCPICGLCFKDTQRMAKPWPNQETNIRWAAWEGHSSKLTALTRDVEQHRFVAKRSFFLLVFLYCGG